MAHKLIDLRTLAGTKARAIERLKESVEHPANGLSTTELRPTTRGGKGKNASADDVPGKSPE